MYKKERTKIKIAQVLRSLMKEKSLSKITVKEICEASDINRRTFYYHFIDKLDVLFWILTSDLNANEFGKNGKHWTESALIILNEFKQNVGFYRKILSSKDRERFSEFFMDFVHLHFHSVFQRSRQTEDVSLFEHFACDFYANGFVSMTFHWIEEGAPGGSKEFLRKLLFCLEFNILL